MHHSAWLLAATCVPYKARARYDLIGPWSLFSEVGRDAGYVLYYCKVDTVFTDGAPSNEGHFKT